MDRVVLTFPISKSIAAPHSTERSKAMVVKIRLARFGKANAPFYNIVVAQARYADTSFPPSLIPSLAILLLTSIRRSARNSKPMEVIGTANSSTLLLPPSPVLLILPLYPRRCNLSSFPFHCTAKHQQAPSTNKQQQQPTNMSVYIIPIIEKKQPSNIPSNLTPTIKQPRHLRPDPQTPPASRTRQPQHQQQTLQRHQARRRAREILARGRCATERSCVEVVIDGESVSP